MKSHQPTEPTRLETGRLLNLLLTEETVLSLTTRDYHWNAAGALFPALHQQFDVQYGLISEWIDEIAERARALDVGALGSWTDLVRTARSSAPPGAGLSCEGMIAALLSLHEALIARLRTDCVFCASSKGDVGTADLLTSLINRHEKTAWMLRAQLQAPQ